MSTYAEAFADGREQGWADKANEIERLTKERDFARDAVVQKCRQYDADMETMRLSLNSEIAETKSLREQLATVREIREYDRAEIKRLRELT